MAMIFRAAWIPTVLFICTRAYGAAPDQPVWFELDSGEILVRTPGTSARLSEDGLQIGESVGMKIAGVRREARLVLENPLAGRANYYLGNDRERWRTGVTRYARVRQPGVYTGIDLVYYASAGRLEFDF